MDVDHRERDRVDAGGGVRVSRRNAVAIAAVSEIPAVGQRVAIGVGRATAVEGDRIAESACVRPFGIGCGRLVAGYSLSGSAIRRCIRHVSLCGRLLRRCCVDANAARDGRGLSDPYIPLATPPDGPASKDLREIIGVGQGDFGPRVPPDIHLERLLGGVPFRKGKRQVRCRCWLGKERNSYCKEKQFGKTPAANQRNGAVHLILLRLYGFLRAQAERGAIRRRTSAHLGQNSLLAAEMASIPRIPGVTSLRVRIRKSTAGGRIRVQTLRFSYGVVWNPLGKRGPGRRETGAGFSRQGCALAGAIGVAPVTGARSPPD
jgi:hypothetical protein